MRKPIVLTARRDTVSRVLTALFGIFLLAVALTIAVTSDKRLEDGPLYLTIVLSALGLEALVSAVLRRPSLLARFGPRS